MKHKKVTIFSMIFLFVVAIGFHFSNSLISFAKEEKMKNIEIISLKDENNQNQCQYNGYADLVEKLLPAVVNISIKGIEEVAFNPLEQFFGRGMMNDDMLNQFFGNRNTIKRKVSALGSGFFIDENGYLVTNYHVVKNANEITVTTQEKEEFKANLVGFDQKTDIAILKIKSNKKMAFVKFGSAAKSRIGDPVIAIGNPFNLGGTVTSGILSAKSRRIGGHYDDFIQIDAPINMGNSGGPTFNIKGEVIGINTVIISPSGGNVGLGFAISSDMVVPILNKIKDGKSIKRGMLGVVIQPITKEIADAVGLKKQQGGFVIDVIKDGPADKAGIKKGDVIMKFDGKEIKEHSDLPFIVGDTEVGKKVSVEIFRYGKNLKMDIIIKEQDEIEQIADNQSSDDNLDKDENVGGLVVRKLNKEIREKFKIPKEIDGLLIIKVKSDHLIENGMIEAGDVIIQVNDMKIGKSSDLKKIFDNALKEKRKSLVFYIYRNGTTIINGITIE